ncbi:MAG: hypothetical protein IT558_05365 [Alphaproteobacteria bacterium]|nr:hypothetical protein [Alphaproteobacteria bacterium]
MLQETGTHIEKKYLKFTTFNCMKKEKEFMKHEGKRDNLHSFPTPPDPRHVNAGGPDASERRAARSFHSPEAREKIFSSSWKGIGQQGNDNPQAAGRRRHLSYAAVAGIVLIAGTTLAMNSSAVVTTALLHTDNSVLSEAMDVSPDAVAAVLNHMTIGE